ncbi:hypothetical protein X751_30990 [Mesorhizobium sp. LNJC395A00]|nr:hypothetical protein X751_30990 [Mesorhizobium sp. LNJC395A00]
MAQHGEIEIGRSAQPQPPHESRDSLLAEIAAWKNQRNTRGVRINWLMRSASAAPDPG